MQRQGSPATAEIGRLRDDVAGELEEVKNHGREQSTLPEFRREMMSSAGVDHLQTSRQAGPWGDPCKKVPTVMLGSMGVRNIESKRRPGTRTGAVPT